MKRILLTTYPTAFLHHGGGEQELHLLKNALNEDKASCDIYGSQSRSINTYDWIIHFALTEESSYLIDALEYEKRQLILWPNLWFATAPSLFSLKNLQELLSKFSAVVFKSRTEESHFRQYFDLKGLDVIRIRPLVDMRFHPNCVSGLFKESYGWDKYALGCGIIEPVKNQLRVFEAFRVAKLPIIWSGEIRDRRYHEQCLRAAGRNAYFIPAMPFASEIHLSALAGCSLYVEVPLDFAGTSALEAAAMGCEVILNECAWSAELLGDKCTTVDPFKSELIADAVLKRWGTRSDNVDKAPYYKAGINIAELISYLRL